MAKQYGNWKELNKQVKNFQKQCQENEARKQLLEYQVEELDEFAIKANEFEEMEEKYNILSSSEELTELSDEITRLLSDDEINANSLIYKALRNAENLAEVDSQYQGILDMLNEALIQIQEASSEVAH